MDRSFISGVISVFCVMVGCTLPRNGTVSDTNTNNDTGADAPSAGEGFEGSSDGTTGKGSPTNPPEDGLLDEPQTFELRTPIEITASSEGVPAAYSLEVSFDHAALVAAGKARADGDDVWVVRIHAGSFTVLPRVLSFGSDWGTATTTLWFRTLSTIAAASSDSSYFLYYGNSTVSGANDDPRDVFELFDDFDGAALSRDWTFDAIGDASGDASVDNGLLHISGITGDISGDSDDFVFLHTEVSAGFVVDAFVTDSGGELGDSAKLGGVMVRQDPVPHSRNRLITALNGANSHASSYRADDGGSTYSTTSNTGAALPLHLRLRRIDSVTHTFVSSDGSSYEELGPATPINAPDDPLRTGIAFANVTDEMGWVEIDWFRLRKYVFPEPATSLGREELGPFTLE